MSEGISNFLRVLLRFLLRVGLTDGLAVRDELDRKYSS